MQEDFPGGTFALPGQSLGMSAAHESSRKTSWSMSMSGCYVPCKSESRREGLIKNPFTANQTPVDLL
jgi:hypothetical protein